MGWYFLLLRHFCIDRSRKQVAVRICTLRSNENYTELFDSVVVGVILTRVIIPYFHPVRSKLALSLI